MGIYTSSLWLHNVATSGTQKSWNMLSFYSQLYSALPVSLPVLFHFHTQMPWWLSFPIARTLISLWAVPSGCGTPFAYYQGNQEVPGDFHAFQQPLTKTKGMEIATLQLPCSSSKTQLWRVIYIKMEKANLTICLLPSTLLPPSQSCSVT